MPIKFYKYQGAGNDFIIVDNRDQRFDKSNAAFVAQLCNRRFGIGADGLMLLEAAAGYDFRMVYYNADGHEGSMCGNGGRCIVAFAHDMGLIDSQTHFIAVDGAHEASLHAGGEWVSLKMSDVEKIERDGDAYILNTGSPHYVLSVEGLEKWDVFAEGKAIRYHDKYRAKGINVNFVQPLENGYSVRTYERGVEDETLACGTGVTAVAIAMAVDNNAFGVISCPIKALGGDLKVRFVREGNFFYDIFLEGPAKFVFAGEV